MSVTKPWYKLDRLVVEVTQADIDAGDQKCMSCPVARAIRRTIKGARIVMVMPSRLWWAHDGKDWNCYTTPAVRHFIDDFDNGRSVGPFSFAIEPRSVEME